MIDEKTLDSILFLSRFSVDGAERKEFASQVDSVLDYFKILERFSPGPAGVSAEGARDVSSLRKDVKEAGLSTPEVKSFATNFLDGYFAVPRILGDEEDA